MRFATFAAVLMLLNSLAYAADSFLGKWDLNVEKSYIEPRPNFRACTKLRRGSAKFTHEQSGYDYELNAECTDGETYHLMSLATFDSRVYPGTLGGKEKIATARRVSERSFKILVAEKQTGKVTEVFLFNISEDNRTLIFTDLKLGEKTPSVTLTYDRAAR